MSSALDPLDTHRLEAIDFVDSHAWQGASTAALPIRLNLSRRVCFSLKTPRTILTNASRFGRAAEHASITNG